MYPQYFASNNDHKTPRIITLGCHYIVSSHPHHSTMYSNSYSLHTLITAASIATPIVFTPLSQHHVQ